MRISGGMAFDVKHGFMARDIYTIGTEFAKVSGDGVELDAEGCYVIPGLLDLHFHGCKGEDFSDGDPKGLQKMAEFELKSGVTYICPAGMTLPEEILKPVCRAAARYQKKPGQGAELVGVNLEGPFLSAAKKGAQNAAFLHDPDAAMLARIQDAAEGMVKLLTVAPELPGAEEFIREAAAMGIRVSVGHTAADYETACRAFAAGARQATHLFNAMLPLGHREPGVVGAAFDNKDVSVELICDGIHIHESVVRAVFRLFGPERVILVSDSLRPTGMPDGRYPFGGQEIELKGRRATMANDPNTLAGSVSTLMDCVRTAVSFGIPLEDAVRAASHNPAAALGLEGRIGSVEPGMEATAVLLDRNDLSVKNIVFKGKVVL
ncbi:MAG: N-acetylglucosamine-6-phosphate deacetylase [Butyricicoccus sp.]|nr:N-acetylglucosamine-6-phosphate deacetylase [Butyricicoccus sp.]